MKRHVLAAVAALGIGAAVIAACDSSSGDYGGPPAPPPADDPGCEVSPAPALGACSSADGTFFAFVDAGTAEAGDAGTSDAEADATAPDDAEAGADADTDAGAGVGAPVLTGCSISSARVVACRERTTLTTAPGKDGQTYVLAVGTRAQLVSLQGEQSDIRKLDAFATGGDAALLLTTPDGEPFIVSRLAGRFHVQTGTAAPSPIEVGGNSFVGHASNPRGSLVVTIGHDGPGPSNALVRRPDGSLATELGPTANAGGERFGLTDDDQLYLIATHRDGDSERGIVKMPSRTQPIELPNARSVVATSTPAGIPPVVALERGALFVGMWDAAASGYGYAKVAPGVDLCPADTQCSNTCTEAGDEVSPGMVALARDRDGTILLTYLRRQIERERRYQKKSGGTGVLCDFFGCPPSCDSTTSDTVLRAELVILNVDPAARLVREQLIIPLPPRPSSTSGYDVGVDAIGGARLRTELRDRRLLVTFEATYQLSHPRVSVYDVKLSF